MKKILDYKLIVYALLVAVTITSCVEDQINRTYTGPSVLEFKNFYLEMQSQLGGADLADVAPFVVVTENTSLNALVVRQQAAPFQDSIRVQLVGPLPTSDIEVSYTVSTVEGAVAVEGTNYQILNTGNAGKFIIRAGQPAGYIRLNILGGLGAADPARVKVIFTLTGATGIEPSANYGTFTYNIIK